MLCESWTVHLTTDLFLVNLQGVAIGHVKLHTRQYNSRPEGVMYARFRECLLDGLAFRRRGIAQSWAACPVARRRHP